MIFTVYEAASPGMGVDTEKDMVFIENFIKLGRGAPLCRVTVYVIGVQSAAMLMDHG